MIGKQKSFSELYNMYHNCDDLLYNELDYADFDELYCECDKDLAKYYEFKCWLEDIDQYYHYN